MRKLLFILFVFLFSLSNNAQTMRQGDITINAYYGYNVFTSFVKVLAQASNSGDLPHNVKITSMGPVGIMAEHLLNNRIGIGGEIGYNQTKLFYNVEGQDNLGILNNYNYVWTVSTTRVMGRVNFHFGDSQNFDFYPFIGAGLRLSSTSLRTDDPNLPLHLRASFFPFGVKPGFGLRYYFGSNIGIYTEMALGTPLVCAGISFKFGNESKDRRED